MEHTNQGIDSFSVVKNSGRVYCAGGWFTPTQEERLYAVKDILESSGYSVFFPKEEALCQPDSSMDWRREVFEGNCKAIDSCSFMVSITDEKDMGTIWEAGYASGKGKPIIYFAETLNGHNFNLMLAQSGVAVALSRDELREILNDPSVMEGVINNKKVKEYSGEIE